MFSIFIQASEELPKQDATCKSGIVINHCKKKKEIVN